jgi:hypothetical protein
MDGLDMNQKQWYELPGEPQRPSSYQTTINHSFNFAQILFLSTK